MKRLLMFSISLFCCILGTGQPVIAQPKYSYAVWSGDGIQSQLVYIDPEQVNAPTRLHPFDTVKVPEGPPPVAQNASPDGRWLVVRSYTNTVNIDVIFVMNVETHEIQEVISGNLAHRANLAAFAGAPQELVWSPDSRYLAINLVHGDIYHIYIYEIATRELVKITGDEMRFHFRAVWSSDSKSLLTTSDFCQTNESSSCDSKLQIFDVPSRKLIIEKDITALGHNAAVVGVTACDFDWSPDGRYINFASICGLYALPYVTRELYVWDLVKDEIRQITDSKTKLTDLPELVGVVGIYAPIWTSNRLLLIGVTYFDSSGLGIRRRETTLYDAETHAQAHVLDHDADYWSINPATHEIAYASGLTYPDENSKFAVVIGQLATDTKQFTMKQIIDRSQDTPPLRPCNLSWSPDGQWLVFLSRPRGCGSQTQYIGFIDREGHIVEYPITDKDQLGVDSVWPVGWVMH